MTDEEKAEDYAKYWIEKDRVTFRCNFEEMKQAYLDGLAEGKPKWHDLRKDPNDLPPRIKRFSETVINQIGTPCRYNFEKSCWQNWSNIDIETPIAWCELPKFKE